MFTAKIAVIISDPNNNDVVSKTLTHEQHVLHNPTRTGTLEMQFLPLSMTVIKTILSLDLMTTMVTQSTWYLKNLSNRFKVGDSLRLELRVVEETNGFENIDLIKNFQDSGEIAEEIDKYLIQ